jgi:3-oxoacyl-[acyl-carrier protein] reductase
VTGASGGIGGAIARRLAREGARVALAYGQRREAAERLAEELSAGGARTHVVGGDLSRAELAGELTGAAERALGPIDVLVANAGTAPVKAFEDLSLSDWERTLSVNLTAPFALAKAVVPGMRERRFGRLLFVSSVAAFTGGVVGPHYAASKAGLNGLTHSLASRFAADGITVNAIAPALIEDTVMLPRGPQADALKARIPVGRLGRPEEVADLALAVLANGYVTNQVLSVDGGIHPR